MASQIQMDVTEADLDYFRQRGWRQCADDLNRLRIETYQGFLSDVRQIVGRPWGWAASRRILRQNGSTVQTWQDNLYSTTPIAAYVHAEVQGWRDE